jgi:hypothetical protein
MGGYIFFRASGGLCDSLYTLQTLIDYAKQYDRTIIVDFVVYPASDLEQLIDFSNYPVKVICKKNVIKNIKYTNIEPSCFKSDIFKHGEYKSAGVRFIDGHPCVFDITKNYPNSTLLVYYRNLGGYVNFKYLKFTKFLLDKYYEKLSLLPSEFHAVHLRATDHIYKHTENDVARLEIFLKNKQNVYLATDNMTLMDSLSTKFPQIIKSFAYKKIDTPIHSLHHSTGSTDPDLLKNAILDILICASSKEFLPSVGGFTAAITNLHTNKELLKHLLKR